LTGKAACREYKSGQNDVGQASADTHQVRTQPARRDRIRLPLQKPGLSVFPIKSILRYSRWISGALLRQIYNSAGRIAAANSAAAMLLTEGQALIVMRPPLRHVFLLGNVL